jgi:Na+/H+ antiporter NhaD/arsenite permease-like protein
MEVLVILVFFVGYALIALEHKTAVNKAGIALLTGILIWMCILIQHHPDNNGIIARLNEHLHDIAQIMFFLLGAMTIVELISAHSGFKILTDFIVVKDRAGLLWLISLLTFFVSAVLDNLTTAIVMTSLVQRLIQEREDRMVFAGMVVVAANAGGAWSPIGDITTTMLWIGGQVTSFNLMKGVFLPSVVSVFVPLTYFTFIRKWNHSRPAEKLSGEPVPRGARRVFALGIGSLLLVPVLRALTCLPPFMGILVGLGVMWVFTDLIHQERHYLRVHHVLTKIDISTILFFLGILLAVAGLESAGILGQFTQWMDGYFKNEDMIVTFLGLLSAVIDNVPLTAAAMQMYNLTIYPQDAKIWELLAFAVGTGGSILIIGSAAGIAVMGMEKIRFGWYMRRISLPVLVGYLAGIGVAMITLG